MGGRSAIYHHFCKILEKYPEGLFPKMLSKASKINYSTVKVYLRDMLKKGLVKQNFKNGPYTVIKPIHGNIYYKYHNIYFSFQFKDIEITPHKEKVQIENIKLIIYFGSKTKKVTCNVSSKEPLNLRELVLVKNLFEQKVKEKLGIQELPVLMIKSIEFNNDLQGIRMDGINAVTWNDFKGVLEKVYNKEDKLRHEFKVSLPVEAESIIHLLRQGLDSYELLKNYNSLDERLGRLEEVNKRIFRELTIISKLIKFNQQKY